MNKFKSKKGFTLAELLIVVAIIAVLVAIAVPLFVSGLQKAEKARNDANIRAVKSAAVVAILNTDPTDKNSKDTAGESIIYKADKITMYSYFKVEATLDDNGNIDATSLKVTSLSEKSSEKDTATKAASGWTITAYLNALDLKGIEPAGE